MTPGTCKIDGCERRQIATGVCNAHYLRMKRHGSYELPPALPIAPRFWAKVDKSGDCWEWTASRAGSGARYGKFDLNGVEVHAHRAAWYFATGSLPPAGMVVCHRCDNTLCVRFSHLFVGTQADNMRDMWAKGRGHDGSNAERGEDRFNARLTDERVREARRLYAGGGITFRELAQRFQVDPKTVRLAVRQKTWKHVT